MKNNLIKTTILVVIVAIMLIYFYWLGTSHAKTIVVERRGINTIEMNMKLGHMVDMRQVVGYESTRDGLQLYFADGTGYFWEGGDK